MKLTQRIVLLAVAVACVAFLSGCGDPEIGITKGEIKIGTWAPLTGPATHLGVSAKAVDAYFKYINEEEGGVHGRKLTLITKDDAYDPTRTPGVVTELVEQDLVFAIVGGHGTANCLAVKDYLALEMVPWVNPGSGSRVWTIPVQAYVFSIYPSYVTEARALAEYAVKELGADRVGMMYQDDSFGREGQEGALLALGRLDKELLISVPYSIGETDFSDKAKQLRVKVLDTVMLWGIPSHVAPLLEEFKKANDLVKFRSMEFHPKLLGSGVLADPSMLEAAGELWEGAIVASGVPNPDSDEPGVVRAREIMSKYAPDVPFGSYALMGLVRAELLVEGIKRAGPNITRVRLILALESLEEWSDNFLGQPITINKDNHQGFDSVQLMKIEDGKHISVTGWLKP